MPDLRLYKLLLFLFAFIRVHLRKNCFSPGVCSWPILSLKIPIANDDAFVNHTVLLKNKIDHRSHPDRPVATHADGKTPGYHFAAPVFLIPPSVSVPAAGLQAHRLILKKAARNRYRKYRQTGHRESDQYSYHFCFAGEYYAHGWTV